MLSDNSGNGGVQTSEICSTLKAKRTLEKNQLFQPEIYHCVATIL